MPDECQVCGRRYMMYGEGHSPNSEICLSNQLYDLQKQFIKVKKFMRATCGNEIISIKKQELASKAYLF